MERFIKALLITCFVLFVVALYSVIYTMLTHYFWWIQFIFLGIGILGIFYIVCQELEFKEK